MNRKAVIIVLAVIAALIIALIAYISKDKPEEVKQPISAPLTQELKLKPFQISIPEEEQKTLGIRTAEVAKMAFKKATRLSGVVEYSPDLLTEIASSFNGNVQNVYVQNNSNINKGDKLLEIMSPAVVEAQKELIMAAKENPVSHVKVNAAREKLKAFRFSDAIIKEIEESGRFTETLTIISPMAGYITEVLALKDKPVSKGTNLVKIANLENVIFSAQAPEYEISMIKKEQYAEILIESYPQKIFKPKVKDILPPASLGKSFRVEMKIENRENVLKPGMTGSAEIKTDLGIKLAVPLEAIIEKEGRKLVYVQSSDVLFSARTITTGVNFGSMTEVTSGLSKGEMVVSSGVTKIDSMAAALPVNQE
jgi:Cu(I)/Ag(I) efflux system membrane fusion protein